MIAGAEMMMQAAPPVIMFLELTPYDSSEHGRPLGPFLEILLDLHGYDMYLIKLRTLQRVLKGDAQWNTILAVGPGGLFDVVLVHMPSLLSYSN